MPRCVRNCLAIVGDDAGAFLAAMLQRVEAEVGQLRRFRVIENAEDAAVMFWIVLLHYVFLRPQANQSNEPENRRDES